MSYSASAEHNSPLEAISTCQDTLANQLPLLNPATKTLADKSIAFLQDVLTGRAGKTKIGLSGHLNDDGTGYCSVTFDVSNLPQSSR